MAAWFTCWSQMSPYKLMLLLSWEQQQDKIAQVVSGWRWRGTSILEFKGRLSVMHSFARQLHNIHLHWRWTTYQPYCTERYQISEPVTCSLRALAMMSSERNHPLSRIPSGLLQYSLQSQIWSPALCNHLCRGCWRKQFAEGYSKSRTVDLYTSELNNQLARFASWHPDPFVI